MGDLNVYVVENKEQRKQFVTAILQEMKALETMFEHDMFERDTMRIGAEQEFCLVDKHYRPAMVAMEILNKIDDSHFTTELAKFNLEANLDPIKFTGDALRKLETQLYGLLQKADQLAQERGVRILLTGILPTIRQSDLNFANITPYRRYEALNEAMKQQRGGDFEFYIKGTDELITKHNTMLFEACNTSFQVHLQVNPDETVDKYNWAQAIAGPVLAACTNSPLLFGKRLWEETRIAVFEQTVDLKNLKIPEREIKSRVDFGSEWLESSITEIYKHDIAYYKLLLAGDIEEDAMEVLRAGKIPKLRALSLFNGTIYKWNRPCYGITDGKPHFRIENRYIPSGPTVIDEIANTAFWLGLMEGMPDDIGNISNIMDFDHAKHNFIKAAQMGLGAQFRWKDDRRFTAQELIVSRLLPRARKGLNKMKIDEHDIDKYLGIIETRVANHQTGSVWTIQAFNELKKNATKEEALVAVTAGMLRRQQAGQPVHSWSHPSLSESGSWASKYKYVRQVMSKEFYTVQEEDQVELVTNVMNWRKIHHVPVENEVGEVVGLISSADIIKYYCQNEDQRNHITVNDIMNTDVKTVTPETPTIDALKLMRTNNLGCLPVVKKQKIIGILTEFDFVYMAEHLFEELQNIEAEDH